MKVLRLSEFVELMKKVPTSEIVTIRTRTVPDMRKTDNPYIGKVVKLSRVNGVISFNYSATVNRQRDREGSDDDFVAKPRKWGTRLPKCPLVEHNGAFYLEMKVTKSLGHEYQTVFGEPFDVEKIKPFMPVKKGSAESQGVEKEIIVRDYKCESIDRISFRGEEYQIIG